MEYYRKHYSKKAAENFADLMKKQGMVNIRIANEYDGHGQPVFTVIFKQEER